MIRCHHNHPAPALRRHFDDSVRVAPRRPSQVSPGSPPTFDVPAPSSDALSVAHRKLAANWPMPGGREMALAEAEAAEARVAFDDAPAQNEPTAGAEAV